MTATSVHGLVVIADEPTESPLPGKNGQPVMLVKTRTLLLEDGSTTYGCSLCDYTSDNIYSIRPHMNKHTKKVGTKPVPTSAVDLSTMTLPQIAKALGTLGKLRADRDEWKRRALDAEAHLDALRKAIGQVTR